MTHHAKLDRWLQLGVHCDGLMDTYFVAKKEAYEKSELACIRSSTSQLVDLDIHSIPGSLVAREHLHFDVRYLFSADILAPLRISMESRAVGWIRLADLELVIMDESALRLRSAISQLKSQK
jgi:hypothetical protein